MDSKGKALAILAVFTIIFYILWSYADAFAQWTKTGDIMSVAVGYMLTNPEHLAIIGFMAKTKGIRGFIASLFVVSAFDIASLAHFITQSGALPNEASSFAGLDTITYRAFYPNFILGTFGLYVLLPTLLLVIAYEIVSPGTFTSLIKRGVGA